MHQFMESPFHPQKFGAFCAVSKEKIVGLFFFTMTIRGNRYEDLMLDFISKLGWNEWKSFFQQDGSCGHTKSITIDFLGPFFGKCLTGLNLVSGVEWYHRVQIYHLWIFFLWAYLKNKVCKTTTQNIPNLKAPIEEGIKKVSKRTLKNVFSNLLKRARSCISE